MALSETGCQQQQQVVAASSSSGGSRGSSSSSWVYKGPTAAHAQRPRVLNSQFANKDDDDEDNETRIISGISTSKKPEYGDFRFKCNYSRRDRGLLICACGNAKIGVRKKRKETKPD